LRLERPGGKHVRVEPSGEWFTYWSRGSSPDPEGWVHGAPTSAIGQSCALCGTRDVAWVHPLASDRVAYVKYGQGYTLPNFWALCERCEAVYASGDDDAAVEVMRSSEGGWSGVPDEDVAECVHKPLGVFRGADLGARRFEPEPPSLVEARAHGFAPLRAFTGAAHTLGPLWPAEHRAWLDELGPISFEEPAPAPRDRWLVRSPWPALSVEQALAVLWPWVERAPFPEQHGAWEARVGEVFGWSESKAVAFLASQS
jgi:hypothetical protein